MSPARGRGDLANAAPQRRRPTDRGVSTTPLGDDRRAVRHRASPTSSRPTLIDLAADLRRRRRTRPACSIVSGRPRRSATTTSLDALAPMQRRRHRRQPGRAGRPTRLRRCALTGEQRAISPPSVGIDGTAPAARRGQAPGRRRPCARRRRARRRPPGGRRATPQNASPAPVVSTDVDGERRGMRATSARVARRRRGRRA